MPNAPYAPPFARSVIHPKATELRLPMMSALRLLAILTFAVAVSACASSKNIVITDGRIEARASAEATQKVADDYRRAGASDAAAPVQKQADARRAEANRKYDGFWDWLVATLLNSWLYSN